jgi:putative thiamine transport system permease protein
MGQALHPLKHTLFSRLRLAPTLTVLALALPLGTGLLGTLMPAFGVLPALGGDHISTAPWLALWAAPGLGTALQLTLATGWLATLLSLLLAVATVAFVHHRPGAQRLGEWLAPLLAMPHSALAIGLAFVLLPSGWLVRGFVQALSPVLTGWVTPPDVATVGHASGWALVLGLLLKEVPYLVLMLLAALNQIPARAQVTAARALGYGPVQAWFAVVLPQALVQVRLPVLAVLAFSLSVVDVALVLGPGNPPTLAVLAVRWFGDPDTQWVFAAAAAATLLLLVVGLSMLLWLGLEQAMARLLRWHMQRGQRSHIWHYTSALGTGLATLLLAAALLAMLGLALWSVAAQWRYPSVLPQVWTWANWQRQAGSLWLPLQTTLSVALASTSLALLLVVGCLESEYKQQRPGPLHALMYLPLLLPQIAFLFGLQVLLVRLGADGQWWAVVWAHLVFVLPYLYLSLADPWRALDDRYARTALSLGASRWRVLWRVKLPLLLKPLLLATAVGFAVSVGLYLPTVFAGAGRVATLTTEALTLSAGADRRVTGVWALLQALFPFVAYAGAALLPRWVFRHRQFFK